MTIQQRRRIFDIAFKILTLIIFLLLLISCDSYKKLKGKPCKSLYSMPVSSPFFRTSYSKEKREIYMVTDLKLADNRNHSLQNNETCEKIPVSTIQKDGDFLKLTFKMSESQFSCYERNINESDITYCTRNNQEF